MYELPTLPYPYAALEPHLNAETMRVHHDVLQRRYIERLNKLTRGTRWNQLPVEQIILEAKGPVFENAAQAWNHTFFWSSMRVNGGGTPSLRSGFGRALTAYGPGFRNAFTETAGKLFGSGWIWLAADRAGNVHIWNGKDADNPMRYGYRPLLVCDLWEHAFYLDYPGRRAQFVEIFLDHLVNWEFAEANYQRAFGV